MSNFRSFKVVRTYVHFLCQRIPFIRSTKCTFLISTNIIWASPTCFGTCVPSSGNTQCQFLKPNCYCEAFVYRFKWYKHQLDATIMIWYDMIYLSTAIGLTHGGSRTVHIYTQTIHRTTQIKLIWKSAGRALSLRVLPRHLPYNWGKSTEKAWKRRNSASRLPAGNIVGALYHKL